MTQEEFVNLKIDDVVIVNEHSNLNDKGEKGKVTCILTEPEFHNCEIYVLTKHGELAESNPACFDLG